MIPILWPYWQSLLATKCTVFFHIGRFLYNTKLDLESTTHKLEKLMIAKIRPLRDVFSKHLSSLFREYSTICNYCSLEQGRY